VGVVLLTVLLNTWGNQYYARYLGHVHPVLVMMIVSALGFLLLSQLHKKGEFLVTRTFQRTLFLRCLGLVFLFALVAVCVDLNTPFPEDINVPFPESLLFYPSIAFLVEIVFHVVPLYIPLLILDRFRKRDPSKWTVWYAIMAISLIEPTFQVSDMHASPMWVQVVVWINLFLFNGVQLFIFRKFGFLLMYLSRIVYYVIWHLIWGEVRLEVIF
jgi:hypothetical protein